MVDHVSLQVKSFAKALSFYTEALAPLGYVPQHVDEAGKSAGFGLKGDGPPLVRAGQSMDRRGPATSEDAPGAPESEPRSRCWIPRRGLARGGKDNGKPGLRPDYHASYYAAFVFDPDGNNVEALTHEAA